MWRRKIYVSRRSTRLTAILDVRRHEEVLLIGGVRIQLSSEGGCPGVATHLVPYETLALVNGQDWSESASATSRVSFLGTESGLWWRWLRGISNLVFRIYCPTLAFDILLAFIERVFAFLRLLRRRWWLMTLDRGRGGVGMMSVILIVLGAGIISVVVLILIVFVVILITAATVRDTIVAVLVVVLNLLVTCPSGWGGGTT